MAKQTFTTGQVLTAAQMTSLQQTAMGGGAATAKTTSYVLVAGDAGTVVQMNAAGATTITVNTALFSAGDTVQIQNIGAGVCTITAGTATVTTAGSLALSQWEGGQLYFTSTGAAIFFDIVQSSGMTNPMTTTGDTIYSSSGSTPARLGIGSTGQVLTVASGVPSWATPAVSSSALTLISNNTFSAVSNYSLANGTFTSTYNNYMVALTTSLSVDNYVYMRLRASGTDNTTSNYFSGMQYTLYASSTSQVDAIAGGQTSFQRVFYPDAGSNTVTYIWTINSPQASVKTGILGYGNRSYLGGVFSSGFFNDTTSFDALSFIPLTGTITGKVQVYGYGL